MDGTPPYRLPIQIWQNEKRPTCGQKPEASELGRGSGEQQLPGRQRQKKHGISTLIAMRALTATVDVGVPVHLGAVDVGVDLENSHLF